ncbi:MAG: hypothetical protein ABR510_10525 [Trueperaceae bacterium]
MSYPIRSTPTGAVEAGGSFGQRGSRRFFRRCAVVVATLILPLALSSCRLGEYLTGVRNGCIEWTADYDFATSDHILRGTWHDAAVGMTLDVTATYVDARSYAVAGTFTYEPDPPLTFEGVVRGGCSETYSLSSAPGVASAEDVHGDVAIASAPPPAFLSAEIRDAGDALVWDASASWGGSSGRPSLAEGVLTLKLGSNYSAELARTGAPLGP